MHYMQVFVLCVAIMIIANFFFIPVMSYILPLVEQIGDEKAVSFNRNVFTAGIFVLLILVVGGFIWLIAKMLEREHFEYLR